MEERAVGGKEKKYVLYTVVNDDKARTGFGVWMVRILLGSLLLVALAVVPYVSLRLAQVNDRTLVVFQPVPYHNHSRNYHHKINRPGSVAVTHTLQSASLVRKNYTTEIPKEKNSNATIVTLHESAVTLSLLEDTNNMSQVTKNQSAESTANQGGEDDDNVTLAEVAINTTSPPIPAEAKTKMNDSSRKEAISTKGEVAKEPKGNATSEDANELLADSNPSLVSVPPEEKKESSTSSASEAPHQEETSSKQVKSIKMTTASSVSPSSTTISSTTSRPITKFSPTKRSERIVHNLAYVATASSGNHVGGVCLWKTNNTVTGWSYFYENIPVEYQSQDSTDHEMRALLAAVRLWSDRWHDYHVVLKSQHQAINHSRHQTRLQLGTEVENLSKNHFTYELEWRQRRDDSVVGVAYCLAKLHKNFDFWFNEFEQRMDKIIGVQDWEKKKKENKSQVPQELFMTEWKPGRSASGIGDLTSIGLF